jgi:hypothetical protein
LDLVELASDSQKLDMLDISAEIVHLLFLGVSLGGK